LAGPTTAPADARLDAAAGMSRPPDDWSAQAPPPPPPPPPLPDRADRASVGLTAGASRPAAGTNGTAAPGDADPEQAAPRRKRRFWFWGRR
jgi:hypothetical protein